MEKGVPIRSISRSFTVLAAINRHGGLSMMEVARATNLPYPTACRIVQTLLYEGLVEQEPSRKRYRPTAMVQALSCGFQQESHLVHTARAHIIGLTERLGWPVSIAVRVGGKMMLRDSTHAHTSLTFERYYPGFTLPIFDSASGKLAMAYAEPAERATVMRWLHLSEDVDHAHLDRAEAELDIEAIQRQGYAVQGSNNFNRNPGKTASISVPIFHRGRFEAAMTMVFFIAAMRIGTAIASYIDELKAAAAAIGQQLDEDDPLADVPAPSVPATLRPPHASSHAAAL